VTDSLPPRRIAAQKRSIKTVGRILTSAVGLVAEKGADPVTMTDIASGARISIGTIYQYFADKSAIMQALLQRHNDEVDVMLYSTIAGATSLQDLIERLQASYIVYAERHRDDPFYRSIWAAVRADTELQVIDARDSAAKGAILFDVARLHYRQVDDGVLMATCALVMHLSMTAARFALLTQAPFGEQITPAYQHMVASSLFGLEQAADHGAPVTG
jgi:AcrR family transcriptional regulator